LLVHSNPRCFREAKSALTLLMLPPPGLSPIAGKSLAAKFDGGLLSLDGGVLVLCEVEQRLSGRLLRESASSQGPQHSLPDHS
jgi:hypothetical protein